MAILKDLEVRIEVDGVPLKEFKDEYAGQSPNSTTSYVEATSGSYFGLKIKVPRTFRFETPKLALSLFLDGNLIESFFISQKAARSAKNGYEASRTAMKRKDSGGFWTNLPFIFHDGVDADFGDEDETGFMIAWLDKKARGAIQAKFLRSRGKMEYIDSTTTSVDENSTMPRSRGRTETLDRYGARTTPNSSSAEGSSVGDLASQPELRTEVEEKHVRQRFISNHFLDSVENPFASFIFKYRSKEALKNILSNPDDPEPDPQDIEDNQATGHEEPLSQSENVATGVAGWTSSGALTNLEHHRGDSVPAKKEEGLDFSQDTSEQDLELLQRSVELAQAQYKLAEARARQKTGSVRVKREREREDTDYLASMSEAKRAKIRPFTPGEVIDLCD